MSGATNLVGVTQRGSIVDVELFSRGFFQKQQYLIKTDQGFFTIAGKVHSVLKGTPVATHLDGNHKETILVIGTGKHARAYKLDGPVITG
ncbi:hypothetical protein [Pseudomonas fluorescens]|uniref:hypothetical protein n=1 Tax=Pseudomonas fluorescens TaxID=294 RepID=UPI0011B1D0F4|nr:hypothetical protein [Pseudomonas fluorescens]